MRIRYGLVALALVVGLAGPGGAKDGERKEGAVKGALIGAGVGALLGGSDAAIKGALAGAVAGNLIKK